MYYAKFSLTLKNSLDLLLLPYIIIVSMQSQNNAIVPIVLPIGVERR